MTVYLVMGGYERKGYYVESHMRLFRLKGLAEEYREKLITEGIHEGRYTYRYDFAKVFEQEVE